MIIYHPNKSFINDIKHLAKSWTMTKVVRSTLLVGVATSVIVLLVEYFKLHDSLFMNLSAFSLLGVILSILLVFRTNSAYDRWWEGRKQWGALVNNCRNLAIQTQISFPEHDKKSRARMAKLISNFCLAFKEHLRNGVKLDELIGLTEEEREAYSKADHTPNIIALEIHQLVQTVYKAEQLDGYDLLNFRPLTKSLLDILGACERIKKTPIPFSYSVYIKLFILSYSVLLPFALVDTLHYWSIPLVMFIFFAFIGLEMMAAEIEEPFGLDCNDLPTGTIANTIKRNVHEILVENKHFEKPVEADYQKIF